MRRRLKMYRCWWKHPTSRRELYSNHRGDVALLCGPCGEEWMDA